MGFDQADDDVDAFLTQQPGALQHGVGLADAGRGAEENEQLAAFALLGERQQRVGIGSALGVSVVGQGFGASLRVEAIIAHGRSVTATPAPAGFASDGGEPDDEQNAGRGEEGGAHDELRPGGGRKRAAGDWRRLNCQSETSARMFARSTSIGNSRKNSIRKFVASRKGRIRVDAASAQRSLQIPYVQIGLPALIAYRLSPQEPAVKLEALRHG